MGGHAGIHHWILTRMDGMVFGLSGTREGKHGPWMARNRIRF